MTRLFWIFFQEMLWPWYLIMFAVQVFGNSRGDGQSLWISSLIVGVITGVMHGTWDRSQGTIDYSAHRGLSFGRQNTVACAAFFAVSTLWFLWPPLIWEYGLSSHNVQKTVIESILTCTMILGGFGLGMWSMVLPIAMPWRVIVLGASLLPYLSVTSDLVDDNLWAVGLMNFVVMVAATLHASYLMDRPFDADLPPRRGWLAPLAVVLLLSTAVHPLTKFEEGGWPDGSFAIEVLTAARSPLTSTIAEHTSLGVERGEFHGVPSRLLFAKPRTGLFWSWLVAILLAIHAGVELRSAGAPRSRAYFWVPAILALGLAAAVARLMFDSCGRWRRRLVDPPPASPPILRSART